MTKTALTCGKCDEGWICNRHPDLRWPHDQCPGPAMPCDVAACLYRVEPRPEREPAWAVYAAVSRSPLSLTKVRAPSSSNARVAATTGQPITPHQRCIRGERGTPEGSSDEHYAVRTKPLARRTLRVRCARSAG
jgi:hypothetical protein